MCVLVTFTCPSLIIPSQTELVMNVHVTVSDIHHDVSKIREEIGNQIHSVSAGNFQRIETEGYLQLSRPEPGLQL